jgi:hypothetical protein
MKGATVLGLAAMLAAGCPGRTANPEACANKGANACPAGQRCEDNGAWSRCVPIVVDGGAPDAAGPASDGPRPDQPVSTDATNKPNGAGCGGPGECNSGQCVEGVCCADPCTASCMSCRAEETERADGTCAMVKTGRADPKGQCAPQTCVMGKWVGAAWCNGRGGCEAPTPVGCEGGYACVGQWCQTSCTGDMECAPTHTCANRVCVSR